MLESLFNISKSSEHEPSTMNWRNIVTKMQSLGPMVDVSPSGVEECQQDSYGITALLNIFILVYFQYCFLSI